MRSEAGPYKLKDILAATSGNLLQGRAETAFSGICTDTRELKTNDLFIPLKGENFDGNSFVLPALEAGARGSLVDRDVHLKIPFHLTKHVLIEVQDTLLALTDLASAHRKILPIPLVAITGSSGKTTVKEMIGAIIGRRHSIKITQGNLNNLIGLPMTVLDIRPDHQFAIVEAGINRPGEMDSLARAARPDVAVITSIGNAHLEGLGSLKNIAAEKFKLVQALSTQGLGIIPEESDLIKRLLKKCHGRIMTFGVSKGDFRAENIKQGNPTTFEVITPFGRTTLEWNLWGLHNISNALAATAASLELGIDLEDVRKGLKDFKAPAWRMEVSDLTGDRKLISDFYNANPLSMKAALETLVADRPNCSTLAILGDMMELGSRAAELHQEIGALAARLGVKFIVYVGEHGNSFADGFVSSGGDKGSISLFLDKEKAWEFASQSIGDFERILVKGSRAMKMELIADRIEKEM